MATEEEEKVAEVRPIEQSNTRILKSSIDPINDSQKRKDMSALKSSLADVDKGVSPVANPHIKSSERVSLN